jgi:hypothetical protein
MKCAAGGARRWRIEICDFGPFCRAVYQDILEIHARVLATLGIETHRPYGPNTKPTNSTYKTRALQRL